MSDEADFRNSLEKIHDMMPLSERELRIIQLMWPDGILEDWRDQPAWYGDKFAKVVQVAFPDEDE